MTPEGFLRLMLQTVTAPREVARLLLSLKLPREALILGFALVIVCNAAVFALSLALEPAPAGLGLLANPLALMVMQGIVVATLIAAFTSIGRLFGGKASFAGMAVLLIWLQALRVAVQLLLTLLLPVAPSVGSLVVMVATAIGAYITVTFIDEAHDFGNIVVAIFVLILGMLAMGFALAILLSLAGFDPTGIADNV